MYKYLSLNKEGFSKNAGFLGIGDTARESSKYVKKDEKKGTPRAHLSVLSYDAPEQKATTAKNMGVGPAKGHRSVLSYDAAELKDKSTDTPKGPVKGHRSVLSYEKAELKNKTTGTTKGPAKGHRSVLSYEKAEPNTRKFNAPANGTPAPTTIVRPLPRVEKPTEPENIEHDPNAVNGINIPEVGSNPDAILPGPDNTAPTPLSAEVFPLGEILVDKPLGADTLLPVYAIQEPAHLDPDPEAKPKPEPKAEPTPEPKAEPTPEPKAEPTPEGKPEDKPEDKPLSRLEVKDNETLPVSIFDDIFSAQHLRNNVLPGAGIAAGIGGLAGALMEDSNPIATALGTGAGAGAGTLLWDYLSRNEDTLKYIKDFLEWAGKNLWEGADGHVKYLAPALGGLAGLLITK